VKTVAALYVDPRGVYATLPGVEYWDEARDARLYAGPHPVVAHPPCARWCRLAKFVEHQTDGRLAVGDDGGTFAAAVASVRRWGGVLEHPAWSLAWGVHGLAAPPARGWQKLLGDPGWVCEVAQSAYGHPARKLTWLYFVGQEPLECDWSKPRGRKVISGMRNRCTRPLMERLWTKDDGSKTSASPPAFAEFLVALARTC